jgi:hypothetical protein
MPVTAQTILARVRTQLIDELATKRWSDDELLRWLSDGQRTLVAMDPTINEVCTALLLDIGTKQSLPENGFILLDIKRNMGADGLTPGRAVTIISRENMDRVDPDWHASRRSDITMHYLYDPQQPTTYYVWPPSTGQSYLDVSRSETPPDFTTLDDAMVIPDIYQTALFDYVMFRAHQKDTDYAAGNEKAQMYLQLFQLFTSGTGQAQATTSPTQVQAQPDLGAKGAA